MEETLDLRLVPSQPCDIDFGWYEAIRAELLRRTVGGSGRVLDVGCGRGQVLLMLSKQIARGIGVDRFKEEIRFARRACVKRSLGNISFRRADAAKLPFRARSFDVVMLLGDVLSYSNLYGKHPKVLAELRRVLRKGGRVIHESMNWTWEYRSSNSTYFASFSRCADGSYRFHRVNRTPSGQEIVRNYIVLTGTPLYNWILDQDWPESPQGHNVSLEIGEVRPIPRKYIRFRDIEKGKHYTATALLRLYRKVGFRDVEVIPYGQTYDIAARAGLLKQTKAFRTALIRAEAQVAFDLRLGSGPWLFLVARR